MRSVAIAVALTVSLAAVSAWGEAAFDQGHWRLELSGLAGLDVGGSDSTGSFLTSTAVEYEFPFSARCTLGLRLMPLFVYAQDTPGDGLCRHAQYDDSSVVGGGAGLALRVYSRNGEYRGWFGEAQVNALGHDGQFNKNSSNLNFLSGIGVGYKFANDWHTVLRIEHISNARLGNDNAGTNLLGLGVGYSF
jgi:hypothetical protein